MKNKKEEKRKKKMKILKKKMKKKKMMMRMMMNYLTRTWERDMMKGNTNSIYCVQINK
jgi:hypothetical protein